MNKEESLEELESIIEITQTGLDYVFFGIRYNTPITEEEYNRNIKNVSILLSKLKENKDNVVS